MKAILAALVCTVLTVSLPATARAAPGWLPPRDLSAVGQTAVEPEIAVDQAGDTVAVWARSNGTDFIVETATHPAGGSWSAPVGLSAAGQSALEPQVAVDVSGDAVAVWQRSDGTSLIVESAAHPAGGSWSKPAELSAAGHGAFAAQVAVDAAGDAVAIWQRFNGSNYIIESAAQSFGGSWSKPAELSAAGKEASHPGIAVDAAGEAMAIWHRSNGTNTIIESAERPAAGSWSKPTELSTAGQSAFEPEIVIDAAGDAAAVWKRSDGSNFIVESADHPAGGTWSKPVELSAAGKDASRPEIAVDQAGEAVAVWERSNGTDFIVEGDARPAGGSWSKPAELSAAGQSALEPRVAIDASGDAVAVWQRSNGTNLIVEGAAHPAGGSWSKPTELSADGQSALVPQIAVDPVGNAAAIWRRSDGTDEIIQAAAFDATGPQLRGVSIPAGGEVGVPLSFSASAFDPWSPLQTSWSFGDGTGAGTASASRAYQSPGSYQVTVRFSDPLGNLVASSATVAITAAAAAPTATEGPSPHPAKPSLHLARAAHLVEARGGKALLSLRCPGPAGPDCQGRAELDLGRGRAAARSLGKQHFRIAAAGHAIVAIRLSPRARRLIAAAGRKGLAVELAGPGVGPQSLRLRPANGA